MNTQSATPVKYIPIKDIPAGSKIIVDSKDFHGYGIGEIKHYGARSGKYEFSFLKSGQINYKIPPNSEASEITESDNDFDYYIEVK